MVMIVDSERTDLYLELVGRLEAVADFLRDLLAVRDPVSCILKLRRAVLIGEVVVGEAPEAGYRHDIPDRTRPVHGQRRVVDIDVLLVGYPVTCRIVGARCMAGLAGRHAGRLI